MDQTLTKQLFEQFAPTLAEERSSELRYIFMQNAVRAYKAKGWTLSSFADKLGVAKSSVSRTLSGICNPTLDTIAKYEAVLETPLIEVNREKSIAFGSRNLPAVPPAAQVITHQPAQAFENHVIPPQRRIIAKPTSARVCTKTTNRINFTFKKALKND